MVDKKGCRTIFKFKFWRTSLRALLTRMFVLSAILPVALTIFLFYAHTITVLTDQALTNLMNTAQRQADFIHYWFDQKQQMVRAIARADDIVEGTLERQAHYLMEHMAHDFGLHELVLVDRKGITIYSTSGNVGIDVSDRSYFRAAMAGQDYISEVLTSKVTNEPVVVISSPVWREGVPDGALFGVVSTVQFQEIVSWANLGDTGDTYLVDQYGRLITVPRFASSNDEVKKHLASDPVFFLPTGQEKGRYRDYRGKNTLAVQLWLPERQWYLVVKRDISEVLGATTGAALGIGLLTGLLSVLLLLPLYRQLAARIARPLSDLAQATERITGDEVGFQVSVKGPAEVVALAGSFNRMSLELAAMHAQMAAQMEELEQQREELEAQNEELAEGHRQLMELNQVLERMAVTDHLTGLYNRRYGFEVLQREVEQSLRYNHPLSILLLDLDCFKEINDTYGHLAGDAALVELAQVLLQTVRRVDTVVRFGGEEFLVITPHTQLEEAVMVGERIRQAVGEQEVTVDGQILRLTVSIGVASLTGGNGSREGRAVMRQMLVEADNNLYAAKTSGRNCLRCSQV